MLLFLPLLLSLPPAALSAMGVSMMFAVIITALFFMAAYALQNPQLIAVSKEELSATIFSGIIILFWLSSDVFFNNLVIGLVLGSVPPSYHVLPEAGGGEFTITHINLAYGCLQILFLKLRELYTSLYLFEVLIGFLSTVSFPIGSPIPAVNIVSLSLAPFTGLVLLSNAHTTVVETIGYTMSLIWAKEFLLLFCRDAIPLIFLPMGLVMRAFPFFRSTGSSIIAICFAGYFVLPFSILLSNYLIFDLYDPVEFTYNPESATPMSGRGIENSDELAEGMIGRAEGEESEHIRDMFSSDPAAAQSTTAAGPCHGGFFRRIMCGGANILRTGWQVASSFVSTVWNMGVFMVGMTGDFVMTLFNNPLMPASVSAGLFYFIIHELVVVSQFLVAVMLTSLFEIVITITMYRNIAMAIGGEPDIAGLTKIV